MSENTNNRGASASVSATGDLLTAVRIAEPAQFRMALMSFLAGGVGLLAGLIAFVLYKLIGLFTNIFFYHRFATNFISAQHTQIGLWIIVTPVIGGIVVGFMAKYGSPKIKGHGIPEAMEAVMFN